MHGSGDGETGIDNQIAEEGFKNMGAWILGRNMYSRARPVAGRELEGMVGRRAALSRPDVRADAPRAQGDRDEGRHHVHFVTDGIQSALKQAKAAAGGRDVRLGGGVATIRQFLAAGLIDNLHLAVRPVRAEESTSSRASTCARSATRASSLSPANAPTSVFLRKCAGA